MPSGGDAAGGGSANGAQVGAGGVGQGAAASQNGLHASLQPVDRSRGTPNMPLNVSVSNTKNLRNGDAVSIHVTPKGDSQIFGFEAFLCSGGTTYAVDADVRPTKTGKCAVQPLSTVSQRYLLVQAQPPYKEADGTFIVGTGSNTFRTDDGRTTSVTCDSSHPCTLVLKLQYPDAFGFQPIPLTFR